MLPLNRQLTGSVNLKESLVAQSLELYDQQTSAKRISKNYVSNQVNFASLALTTLVTWCATPMLSSEIEELTTSRDTNLSETRTAMRKNGYAIKGQTIKDIQSGFRFLKCAF